MKKVSICIPVFNEEENILNAYESITKLFISEIVNYEYEIIFTDNHSTDQTENIITKLTETDNKIKYIRFKNNLGYDKSILEGYKNASGDLSIVIDCDLQDPVNIIKSFLKKWEIGYDVVYGIRKKRNENKFFTLLRKFYYRIMSLESDVSYPNDAGGFRLVDKSVIQEFKDNNNLSPYIRGLTFSLAKNPIGIDYERVERKRGKSKLGYYNTFTYAINALIEETSIFVRYFGRLSLVFFICSILFTFLNFFNDFIYASKFENLIILILSLFSIFLSIMGEYILRIYLQLKKTKRLIYEKKLNL